MNRWIAYNPAWGGGGERTERETSGCTCRNKGILDPEGAWIGKDVNPTSIPVALQ